MKSRMAQLQVCRSTAQGGRTQSDSKNKKQKTETRNANLAETGGANVSQELYKLEQQHKKPKPVQPQVQMK